MSRYLCALFVGAVALLAACSPASSSSTPAAAPTSVARGSFAGAGGTCGNYTNADGEPYLGINRLTSAADYRASLAAVPDSIYPVRQALPGIGEEAVLFSDSAQNPHLRYLIARSGEQGIVIFPFSNAHLTDDQLKDLAAAALK